MDSSAPLRLPSVNHVSLLALKMLLRHSFSHCPTLKICFQIFPHIPIHTDCTDSEVYAHIHVHILKRTKLQVQLLTSLLSTVNDPSRFVFIHALHVQCAWAVFFHTSYTHIHENTGTLTHIAHPHTYIFTHDPSKSVPLSPLLHSFYPVKEKDAGSDSMGLWQILLQWLPWRSECFWNLNPMSENVKCILCFPRTKGFWCFIFPVDQLFFKQPYHISLISLLSQTQPLLHAGEQLYLCCAKYSVHYKCLAN